ncbi:MAG: SseB family protein [Planctomycetaceae bacterium]|nr:SseB family protein [Planctomycetaceae bacterium]
MKQSQVVALFNGDPTMAKGMRLNAQPLLLNSSDGEPMLAIFTSIERSKIWSQKQTDFSFGMQVPFEWLLRGTVSGVGLVINPGSTVGLEMSPAGVTQLKANAGWA